MASGLAAARYLAAALRFAAALCLAAALCGVAIGGDRLAAQAPAPSRSVRDGVYTDTQAARGTAVYEGTCLTCHAARMWGSDWTERSLWDLYDTISMFMPEDRPGSLSDRQVRDVIAYILKTNKLPAGTHDLPESPEDLRQIRLDTPSP